MIKIDSIALGAPSELFINLSVAWLFTGMLAPFSQDQISLQTRIIVLAGDFLLGTSYAFILRASVASREVLVLDKLEQ
jgi:hypothetical protein